MLSFKDYLIEKNKIPEPTGELKSACWSGYTAVGMKMKNGKKVPNCVPTKEELETQFDMLEEAAKAIDSGEYDYEGQMARTQLQTIYRNSKDLIDMLNDEENMPEWVQSKITLAQDYITCVRDYLQSKDELEEATYQGKTVTLNKPMAGDVKKSKVYVDLDGDGKAKKVNFGDKNMTIKKNIPARRKSFRARHNCDNPGPKDKARYWSCRAW
jgi:hypothetical protein